MTSGQPEPAADFSASAQSSSPPHLTDAERRDVNRRFWGRLLASVAAASVVVGVAAALEPPREPLQLQASAVILAPSFPCGQGGLTKFTVEAGDSSVELRAFESDRLQATGYALAQVTMLRLHGANGSADLPASAVPAWEPAVPTRWTPTATHTATLRIPAPDLSVRAWSSYHLEYDTVDGDHVTLHCMDAEQVSLVAFGPQPLESPA